MPRTYLTGANVAEFAQTVRAKAGENTADLRNLAERLDQAHGALGLEAAGNDRLAAVRDIVGFLDRLTDTGGNVAVIDALANPSLPVALQTAGNLRSEARRDETALRGFKWKLLDTVIAGAEQSGVRGDGARAIVKNLREVIVTPGRSLSDEMGRAESRVVDWVVGQTPQPPSPDKRTKGRETVVVDPDKVTLHETELRDESELDALTAELRKTLQENGSRVRVKWWIE
ncbi:MAG: hypothetical protein EOO67_16660 [Microbacterium sp.]|nr:MAG: hypothetical protein EOO67_16660 [Microbacterium sp.]